MSTCDAHGAVFQSDQKLQPKEGYLLDARFMQDSNIQEMLVDRDISTMNELGLSRSQYKAQVESLQGTSPWLLCERCVRKLNLGQSDLNSARKAAFAYGFDRTALGHIPQSPLECLIEATSEAEANARIAAFQSLGNQILGTEWIRTGIPLTSAGVGESYEAAKKDAMKDVSPDTFKSEDVLEASEGFLVVGAYTENSARSDALGQLGGFPHRIHEIERVSANEMPSIQSRQHVNRLVDAFSPHEARRNARLEEHLVVDRVIEVKRPRTGILGIGRQPGTYTVIVAPPPCYRVSWTRPWWVLVKSGEKISVRVTFRRIGS